MFDSADNITLIVSNAEELKAALTKATGGETILLRSGDYGNLSLYGKHFSSAVTIRSENPGAPAKLGEVSLSSVSNFIVDTVIIDFVPDEETTYRDSAVTIKSASNISIRNSIIEGGYALDSDDRNVEGLPVGRGIEVYGSSDISIAGNDISLFHNAVVMTNSTNLTITNNEIHDLRTTPIKGGNVSNVVIDGNYLHDSTPWNFGGSGDHGDFIHFWTRAGWQNEPSANFTITNNVLAQGSGTAMLGIYLDDDGNNIGFTNVTIESNLIHNGNGTGIRLENTHDSLISANTLLQATGDANDAPGVLLTAGSSHIEVSDNILSYVAVKVAAPEGIVQDNNLFVQAHNPKADNYYGDLFVNALAALPELSDLQALPGGLIEELGVGASITRFNATPEKLTAIISSSDSGDGYTYHFSAALTADAAGFVGAEEAQFIWDFGDGTTAEGMEVAHRFAAIGEHKVKLLVIGSDGSIDESHTEADVFGPHLLNMAFSPDGIFDESGYSAPIGADPAKAVFVPLPSGSYAYRLNNENDITVSKGEWQLYDLEAFSISFALQRDSAELGAGDIARLHSSWRLILGQDGEVTFDITNAEDQRFKLATKGAAITDTEWHAVTLTYDMTAGRAVFYVDGKEVGSMNVAGSTQPMESWGLSIGNPYGANFNGLISDVEVHSRALNAAEAADLHHQFLSAVAVPPKPEIEPVYVFSFDDDTPCTLCGDTKKVLSGSDYVLQFDGDGDYARLGRLSDIADSTSLTVAFEFCRSDPSDSDMQRLVWNHTKYGIELKGDTLQVRVGSTESNGMRCFNTSGLDLLDSEWHQAALVMDEQTGLMQLYLDGEVVISETVQGLSFSGANRWDAMVGGTGWGYGFNGQIDSIALADQVLTVEQLQDFFAGGIDSLVFDAV